MRGARVLRNSTIFDLAEHNHILMGPSVQIGGNDIKLNLIGDSAYSLASWLQKPFPEAMRDPEEIAFDKALSGARVAVECTFGNGWKVRFHLPTKSLLLVQSFTTFVCWIKMNGMMMKSWPSRSRTWKQQGCYKGWGWRLKCVKRVHCKCVT